MRLASSVPRIYVSNGRSTLLQGPLIKGKYKRRKSSAAIDIGTRTARQMLRSSGRNQLSSRAGFSGDAPAAARGGNGAPWGSQQEGAATRHHTRVSVSVQLALGNLMKYVLALLKGEATCVPLSLFPLSIPYDHQHRESNSTKYFDRSPTPV